MNVSSDIGSPRVINADAKEAELRGKYSRYDDMEQTPEVLECKRMIRRCIAELRATPTYDGGAVVVVHRNEEVVRCAECRYFEHGDCRNPRGMLAPKPDGFCSAGKSREHNGEAV